MKRLQIISHHLLLVLLVLTVGSVPAQEARPEAASEPKPILDTEPLQGLPSEEASGEQSLRIGIAGKGEIAAGRLVMVEPGELIEFRLGIHKPDMRAGDIAKEALLEEVGGIPGRYRAKATKEWRMEIESGEVKTNKTGALIWRAPEESGLQWLGFEVEEIVSIFGPDSEEAMLERTFTESDELPVMVMFPFDHEGSGVIDGYGIGVYPNEESAEVNSYVARHKDHYKPPKWFLRITPKTADIPVSEHFTLGDFSPPGVEGETHFIALEPRLIDFLEDIRSQAVEAFGEEAKLVILRSFMSPNERLRLAQQGVDYTRFSRYQYGDAAAIALDLDSSAHMSDLNGDDRLSREDAEVLAELVESVKRDKEYRGGIGIVRKPVEEGWPEDPFVVVDLRGVNTRW